jgi:hypothetical protein
MAKHSPETVTTEAIRALRGLAPQFGGCELACARSLFTHAVAFGDFKGFLARLTAIAEQMADVDEARVARGICAHYLAAMSEFCEDPRRSRLSTRNLCLLALDEADLRMRAEVGRPLRTTPDYKTFKPKNWGPSLTTIEREFGSWHAAKGAAALLSCGQPEMQLGRPKGRRKSDGPKPTLEERVVAMAKAIERNFGRRVSTDGYDDIREDLGSGLPSYNQLIGVAQGSDGGTHELGIAQVDALARKHILKHRKRYPVAYDYIRRTRKLRGKAAV